MDDIIVMAATFQQHLKLLIGIFTLLRNAGLRVKLENFQILRREIKYLTIKIIEHGTKTDSEKNVVITSMSLPLKF